MSVKDFMGIIFYGIIDEMMIFNRALSAGEIQNIYDSQKPIAMESSFSKLASILDAIKGILEKIKSLF